MTRDSAGLHILLIWTTFVCSLFHSRIRIIESTKPALRLIPNKSKHQKPLLRSLLDWRQYLAVWPFYCTPLMILLESTLDWSTVLTSTGRDSTDFDHHLVKMEGLVEVIELLYVRINVEYNWFEQIHVNFVNKLLALQLNLSYNITTMLQATLYSAVIWSGENYTARASLLCNPALLGKSYDDSMIMSETCVLIPIVKANVKPDRTAYGYNSIQPLTTIRESSCLESEV